MTDTPNDELLHIIEDDLYEPGATESPGDAGIEAVRSFWKILIADDEPAVHETTLYSLKDQVIFGKGLEFYHAYSAGEAYEQLRDNPDIAVVFLDVVMETVDAGLKLVPQIRHKLKRHSLRIILRTGQPGYAPEEKVVSEYDINDYHNKSEMTFKRMMTALKTALRNYREVEQLLNAGHVLQRIIEGTEKLLACTQIETFSDTLLQTLEYFFSQPLNGYVVVLLKGGQKAIVTAACGKFSKMRHRDIYEIEDVRLTGHVKGSLISGNNYIDQREAALYFASNKQPVVACVNRSSEDFTLCFKQYHLDMLQRNVSMCLNRLLDKSFKEIQETHG